VIKSSSALLAVDASLRSTGWAVFSLKTELPISFGLLTLPTAQTPLAKRLDFLQQKISLLFGELKLSADDYLVCEGPAPLVLNPQSAIKVEHVRSMFETLARANGLIVPGRLNPRTIQSELLGMRGRQAARTTVKDWARETAQRLFAKEIKAIPIQGVSNRLKVFPQDVIDALLIGSLATSRIKNAIKMNYDPVLSFSPKNNGRANRRTSGSSRSVVWTEKSVELMKKRRHNG